MMNDLGAQYATGLSRRNIEQALIAAGKDPGRLQPADLGNFAVKAANLTRALSGGRLRAIQGVALAAA